MCIYGAQTWVIHCLKTYGCQGVIEYDTKGNLVHKAGNGRHLLCLLGCYRLLCELVFDLNLPGVLAFGPSTIAHHQLFLVSVLTTIRKWMTIGNCLFQMITYFFANF